MCYDLQGLTGFPAATLTRVNRPGPPKGPGGGGGGGGGDEVEPGPVEPGPAEEGVNRVSP